MLTPLLTVEQTAEHLGIKVKTVHQFVREGRLACIQVTAKGRKFTEAQIQEFIESRTTPMPKFLDRKSPDRLPSPPKRGGDYRKSTAVSLSERAKMREEARSWL